jgi:hypothetical protein
MVHPVPAWADLLSRPTYERKRSEDRNLRSLGGPDSHPFRKTSMISKSAMRTKPSLLLIPLMLFCGIALANGEEIQKIHVSPDHHFLAQENGSPFFWLGENAWELFQRPNTDSVDRYLADRASKGFNVILAVIGGVHREPNFRGDWALVDNNPNRPNPRYFAHVDCVVDRAAKYGLHIAIVPFWGGKIVSNDPPFNAISAKTYAHWVAERYRNKGVIWILGGDVNPFWISFHDNGVSGRVVDFRAIYDAFAEGIFSGEGGTPLITYHPSCCSSAGMAPPRTSLYLGDRSWLTINMLQSSHYKNLPSEVHGKYGFAFGWRAPFNYEPIGAEYESSPTRPIIDGEALFEDLGIDNDPPTVATKGYWGGTDSLRAAYHSVFAGAAGHTYGNHSIWQFYDPAHNRADPPARLELSWEGALSRPTSSRLAHLKSLMLSRPYFSRIPDQSLLDSNSGQGAEHISATRDAEGSYAMIFVPGGRPVRVDLSKMSGQNIDGWWFDIRTGLTERLQSFPRTTSVRTFTAPTQCGNCDWVLILDDASRNFSVPGRPAFVG